MTCAEAHRLLDAAVAGAAVCPLRLAAALIITGDLAGPRRAYWRAVYRREVSA